MYITLKATIPGHSEINIQVCRTCFAYYNLFVSRWALRENNQTGCFNHLRETNIRKRLKCPFKATKIKSSSRREMHMSLQFGLYIESPSTKKSKSGAPSPCKLNVLSTLRKRQQTTSDSPFHRKYAKEVKKKTSQ